MFRGNFPAKIDAQGRIKIPTAHRTIFDSQYSSDVFVTSTTGQNVLIFPLTEWEKIEARLLEPPKMVPAKLRFLRNTSYYGQVSTMDKQGRVVIQPHLRLAAEVDGEEVAIMGQLTHLEIWNKARFLKVLEADPYTEGDTLSLADLGI